MKSFLIVLVALAAACGHVHAQNPVVTVSATEPGQVQFVFTTTSGNYGIFGIPSTSTPVFAQWGVACTTKFASTATTGECRPFTCTAANTCTIPNTPANVSTTSASPFTYTRVMMPITGDTVGLTVGANTILTAAGAEPSTTFANTTIQGLAAAAWTSSTVTIAQLTANPSFTYAVTMPTPDVVSITMTTTSGKYQGMGWFEPQTTYPSWAAICSPLVGDCAFVQCTNFNTCTSAAAAFNSYQVSRSSNIVTVQRNAVGPSTTAAIVSGAQTNMMWMQSPNPLVSGGTAAAPAAQSYRSWAMFTTGPTIAAYTSTAPSTFTYAMSATSPTSVAMTFTTASGMYDGVGFELAGTSIPAYVVLCDPTLTTACVPFTCAYTSSTATTCAAASTTGTTTTGVSASKRTVTFTRPWSSTDSTPHVITPGAQKMLWIEGASVASLTTAQAAGPYTSFQSTLAQYQGTAPTFGVTATTASTTTTQLDVTTNSGKYALVGIGNGSTTYPPLAIVCEPVSLANCGIYTCSSATACTDNTTSGITQTRDAANRHQTLIVPNSALPSRLAQRLDAAALSQASASTSPYLYWVEQAIPASGLTLSSSLAQSQSWNMFLLSVAPQSTTPTFPITFTLPAASTLGISMVPGTAQMGFLGWRQSASALYPSDAIICAPSSVSTCLDVTCSSASACTSRATTIYTSNTASGTSATLQRAFAPSGAVPITAGTMMQLAWDIASTPSGTTTLQASSANSRTWKYYTAAVPTATTGSSLLSIPFAISLFSILYIL